MVATDIEIVALCDLLHCLPSDLMNEDPIWIWKIKTILAEKANKQEKDMKEAERKGRASKP